MLKMDDLFSGLGGASQAMVDSPHWEVLRVDNFPLLRDVPHTMLADLTEDFAFDAHWFNPKVVWASPPCTQFSTAYSSPSSIARREGEEWGEQIDWSCIEAAMKWIRYFKPDYWVLENVRGGSRLISQRLGIPPRQIIGQYFLWGNFPYISMPRDFEHSKYTDDTWSTDVLRAWKRAKVPYPISHHLRLTLEEQTTLKEWI